MKFNANNPSYPKGFELEVPGVGFVANGTVIELTDIQVSGLEATGVEMPASDGTYDLYQESDAKPVIPVTTNLPGIAEIAEMERAKSAPKPASIKEK